MAAKLLTQTRNIPTNLFEPNFLLSHQRVLRQSHLRYLINILEIVITRAAPAFHKLFMVTGCVFDINTVDR